MNTYWLGIQIMISKMVWYLVLDQKVADVESLSSCWYHVHSNALIPGHVFDLK